MLSVKALLKLSWEEACQDDDFREVVWKGLGNKGPWKHYRQCSNRPQQTCAFCGKIFSSYNDWMTRACDDPCPAPPPITLEPEVVAERLKEKMMAIEEKRSGDETKLYSSIMCALRIIHPQAVYGSFVEWWWFGFEFTPVQRSAVCLRVLDLLGE